MRHPTFKRSHTHNQAQVEQSRKRTIGRPGAVIATAVAVVGLASCSGSTGSQSQGSAPTNVKLTLWQNLGNGNQATVVPILIKAFEKANPTITITNVAQPRSNYFALLQAAAVSKTGPDLVNMWTGLFTMQYRSYLTNLKSWVPAQDLQRMGGTQWSSVGFNKPTAPYVIPLQQQFYVGFYNKSLFAKAGISSVPTDWAQLFTDCAKLKAIHTTCIEEGTQNLTGEFYPWYNLSYLMAGALTPSQWEGLYNGQIKWSSPVIETQLTQWHQLYTDGYMNSDALTATNVQSAFTKGQAAIIIKGNWDTAPFTKALGSNVGVFIPPYSTSPTHKIVEFAGNGFAMTSYSPHKAAAAKFLQFMTTEQAGTIIANAGLVPAVTGVGTTNPLAKTMLTLASSPQYTVYPMLDNILAPGLVTAGSTVFPDMLKGGISVPGAAKSLEQAWQQLPPSERGTSWATYQVPAG